jgi:hypothetical protein
MGHRFAACRASVDSSICNALLRWHRRTLTQRLACILIAGMLKSNFVGSMCVRGFVRMATTAHVVTYGRFSRTCLLALTRPR